jgi:hypothetical protein
VNTRKRQLQQHQNLRPECWLGFLAAQKNPKAHSRYVKGAPVNRLEPTPTARFWSVSPLQDPRAAWETQGLP